MKAKGGTEEDGKKRERGLSEAEPEGLLSVHTVKKRKPSCDDNALNKSEVVNTSLDWSQVYK